MNKFARITIKTVLWILAGIIMLIVLAFVLIEVPAVQNVVRKKAVSFLEKKIGTPVEIDRLSLDLPKQVVLEGVYFEDRRGDTLLAGDTLKVDISMLKLLRNQVELNMVDLRGITANVRRTMPDSAFNFDYIINAFVSQSQEPAPPPDSTAAMKFSVSRVNLDRIRVRYSDAVAASDMDVYLGHFDTDIREFNLDSLRFSIPEIRLAGLDARISQRKPVTPPPVTNEATPPVTETAPGPVPDIRLGRIDLSAINVDYDNEQAAIESRVNLGKLLITFRNLDLEKQDIRIGNLELRNTKTLFRMSKTAQKAAENTGEQIANEAEKGWTVSLDDLLLAGNDLRFDDLAARRLPRGIDYSHLDIRGLSGEAEQIRYSPQEISGKIRSLSMRERSGLNLKQLRTEFLYGSNQAYLEDLYVQTPGTVLRDRVRLTYPSLESITKDPGSLGIEADLTGSRISTRDILIFMPDLAGTSPFNTGRDLALSLDGRVSGRLNDLSIPGFRVSGLTGTRLAASGRITGLPDMNRAYFNVTLQEFRSGRRDLEALVSKGMIPDQITVPENFRITGAFRGTMEDFNGNMVMNSSLGSLVAAGSMQGEKFSVRAGLTNLQAGKLLKQEGTLGRITATATVRGSGLDPAAMNAVFNLDARRAEIKGYPYRDFTASGSVKGGNLVLRGNIRDPNIRLSLDARASGISRTYPSLKLSASVDSADLHALHLYPEPFRLAGNLSADLPSTNPDSLAGHIEASGFQLALKGEQYALDSVRIVAAANGDQRKLRLTSEVVSADLNGRYRLTEIGNVLTNQVNRHFRIGDGRELPVSAPHEFTLTAHVTNRPVLQTFIPSLTRMESADFRATVNSTTGEMTMNGVVPQVVFMGYNVRNLKLDLSTDSQALNYSVNLDNAGSAGLQLNRTSLTGKIKDNELGIVLNVQDIDNKDRYRLLGTLSVDGPQYRFRFAPEGLLLNYDSWTVSPENSLEFGPDGLLATDFTLSRQGQELSLVSEPQSLNAPLSISLTNFRIETLTSIAQKDSLLAGGLINGSATVRNLETNPVFNADLRVAGFTFMADTVGDIELQVNNQTEDTFTARASVTGNGNDIRLDGFYYTPPRNRNSFDLDLDIRTLNLASVEGFTMGSLKQASGTLAGTLRITGTPAAPAVRGDLLFSDAAFNVAMLNAFYRLDDQRITFTSRGIELNDFTLNDSVGNEAVIDGTIYTTNYLDYRFG
ncbi:MAG TPA: translocation/assembly module TamB, partial [Sphingobacteriaceae bacterium]